LKIYAILQIWIYDLKIIFQRLFLFFINFLIYYFMKKYSWRKVSDLLTDKQLKTTIGGSGGSVNSCGTDYEGKCLSSSGTMPCWRKDEGDDEPSYGRCVTVPGGGWGLYSCICMSY